MSRRGRETRERIVLAAIEFIEQHGVSAVTVRAVASKAEVNVAAVNYHFGSKDALVQQALGRTLGNLFEDLDAMLEKEHVAVTDALSELYGYLLEGIRRHGGVARAHLEELFLHGEDRHFLRVRFAEFLEQFRKKLARLPGGGTESVALRLEQGVSALLFSAMMPDFFESYWEKDGGRQPGARSYIASLSGSEWIAEGQE